MNKPLAFKLVSFVILHLLIECNLPYLLQKSALEYLQSVCQRRRVSTSSIATSSKRAMWFLNGTRKNSLDSPSAMASNQNRKAYAIL
ncbi:MAG: hypothetical protein HC848_10040 [Limnobacter sp.]|nr:hypothetical protein [Limnobacter sp.]